MLNRTTLCLLILMLFPAALTAKTAPGIIHRITIHAAPRRGGRAVLEAQRTQRILSGAKNLVAVLLEETLSAGTLPEAHEVALRAISSGIRDQGMLNAMVTATQNTLRTLLETIADMPRQNASIQSASKRIVSTFALLVFNGTTPPQLTEVQVRDHVSHFTTQAAKDAAKNGAIAILSAIQEASRNFDI